MFWRQGGKLGFGINGVDKFGCRKVCDGQKILEEYKFACVGCFPDEMFCSVGVEQYFVAGFKLDRLLLEEGVLEDAEQAAARLQQVGEIVADKYRVGMAGAAP